MEWWDWCLLSCLVLVLIIALLCVAGYLFFAWSYGLPPFRR